MMPTTMLWDTKRMHNDITYLDFAVKPRPSFPEVHVCILQAGLAESVPWS